jgi:hypothetical protein
MKEHGENCFIKSYVYVLFCLSGVTRNKQNTCLSLMCIDNQILPRSIWFGRLLTATLEWWATLKQQYGICEIAAEGMA